MTGQPAGFCAQVSLIRCEIEKARTVLFATEFCVLNSLFSFGWMLWMHGIMRVLSLCVLRCSTCIEITYKNVVGNLPFLDVTRIYKLKRTKQLCEIPNVIPNTCTHVITSLHNHVHMHWCSHDCYTCTAVAALQDPLLPPRRAISIKQLMYMDMYMYIHVCIGSIVTYFSNRCHCRYILVASRLQIS